MAGTLDVELSDLQASRYLTAAGLVMMLYDHVLTFSDEVHLVWRARRTLSKWLFLFNRYTVPLAMIVLAYGVSGLARRNLTSTFCKGWIAVVAYTAMMSMASGDFLVLLRLWILRRRNTHFVSWTFILFVLTQVASVGLTTWAVVRMMPYLVFDLEYRSCLLTQKIHFEVMLIPGVAFQGTVFLATCWHLCSRICFRASPKSGGAEVVSINEDAGYGEGAGAGAVVKGEMRSRDSPVDKMSSVQVGPTTRDGENYYFLIIFVLRIFSFVSVSFAPLSLIFLGIFFSWCVTNVALSRLVFDLRRPSSSSFPLCDEPEPEPEPSVSQAQDRDRMQAEVPVFDEPLHPHNRRRRERIAPLLVVDVTSPENRDGGPSTSVPDPIELRPMDQRERKSRGREPLSPILENSSS